MLLISKENTIENPFTITYMGVSKEYQRITNQLDDGIFIKMIKNKKLNARAALTSADDLSGPVRSNLMLAQTLVMMGYTSAEAIAIIRAGRRLRR